MAADYTPDTIAADHYFAQIPEDLLHDKSLSPMDVRVYGALRRFADQASGKCFPSHATIAEKIGTSARTVRRSCDDLTKAGWLVAQRRKREDGGWSSNNYVVRSVRRDPIGHTRPMASDTGDPSHRTQMAEEPEPLNQSHITNTLPLLGEERPAPKKPGREALEAEFKEWWEGIWNKDAKQGCMKHYIRIRSKGLATREHMFLQRDMYVRLQKAQGTEEEFWKIPLNWLGQGLWENDYESKLEKAEAKRRSEVEQRFTGPEVQYR